MSWTVWLTLAVGVLLIIAWKRHAVRLSPEEAEKIRRAVADGAVVLDVRTPTEFQRGHLDGAMNVPLDDLMQGAGRIGRKNRPVVVYCHSGARSGMAVSYLRRSGFARAHDLRVMRNWAGVSR